MNKPGQLALDISYKVKTSFLNQKHVNRNADVDKALY